MHTYITEKDENMHNIIETSQNLTWELNTCKAGNRDTTNYMESHLEGERKTILIQKKKQRNRERGKGKKLQNTCILMVETSTTPI